MSAHTENLRVCRRCLIGELNDEGLAKLIARAKVRIPEEERASQAGYEARLSACRTCDELENGMCRVCGCYVEVRAMIRDGYCPAVHPRWEKEE